MSKKKKEDKVSQKALDIVCKSLETKFQEETPKLKSKVKEAGTNEEMENVLGELKAVYAKYKTDLKKLQAKVATKQNSKSTSADKLEEKIEAFFADELRKLCVDLITKSHSEFEASSKVSMGSDASLVEKKVKIVLLLKKNLQILQPLGEEDKGTLCKVFNQLGK